MRTASQWRTSGGGPAAAPSQPLSQRVLRGAVEAVLLALVVFTPLAFGSVQPWAIATLQTAAMLCFALWIASRLWYPEAGDPSGLVGSIRTPLERAGVALSVAVFVGLVIFQLVPLPPWALALTSPAAGKLYTRTLPHDPETRQVDFRRTEDWLLAGAGTGSEDTKEALSWIGAEDPVASRSPWRTLSLAPSSTRRAFGLLLAYLMLFVVGGDRAREERFRARLLWTIAVTGALVGMLGLAQETTWGDRLYGRIRPAYGGSPIGPFVNRNHFAGYLEMSLSVFAGLWLALLRREERGGSRIWGTKPGARATPRYIPQLFMLSLFLAVGALALWKSGSRGGLVAAGAVLVIFSTTALCRAAGAGRRWRFAALCLILVAAAGFCWKVYELTRLESLEPDLASEPSFGRRLRIWQASLGMFVRFLGLGSGFGTYGYAVPLYQGGGYDRLWIYAHNEYVQIACETGALGLALVVVGLAGFSRRFLLPVWRNPLAMGSAALGCVAGITSLLIHSFVDFNLQIPANGLLFVLLGALLAGSSAAAAPSVSASGETRAPGRGLKLKIALLGVPLLACCGIVGRSALAREWQERATAYFWEGDLSQAHERLEKAVRMAPGIPEVQADAGFFYLRVLELDDDETQPLGLSRSELLGRARAAFLRAINLLPVNSNAWSGLAEVYLQASVEQLRGGGLDLDVLLAQEGAGRLDRLYVAVVRKMMMLEPRNPYFHARLGDFLWDRGSRAAALSAYEDAFRLLPKIEEHPFLSRQGIPQEVLAAAVRGGEQFLQDRTGEFPAHVGHFNLSQLYVLLGDYPSAFRHLEAAVELLPEFSYYHYKLAALCFERGELERSRELAGRSIELGMRSEFPFILLARIARQRGETEEAIRFYRRALSSNPQNGRAALELAQEYERMRDFSRAEANYELAVELLPQDVHVLMQAVDYYTRRGSNVRAIPVLRKVVALRPHDEVYRQRLVQLSENEYMLR